ncbi:MAG: thioredoxin family protein [Calditrichaceae bacterium]
MDKYAVTANEISSVGEGIQWQPYSEKAVEEAKSSGNPVFIDFTAAWCLSCQVNEQVAFSSQEVQDKFEELNIRTFKADWTSHDENVTRALAKYGRNSVPLYVLHSGKTGDEPKVLPEIITPGIILNALNDLETSF